MDLLEQGSWTRWPHCGAFQLDPFCDSMILWFLKTLLLLLFWPKWEWMEQPTDTSLCQLLNTPTFLYQKTEKSSGIFDQLFFVLGNKTENPIWQMKLQGCKQGIEQSQENWNGSNGSNGSSSGLFCGKMTLWGSNFDSKLFRTCVSMPQGQLQWRSIDKQGIRGISWHDIPLNSPLSGWFVHLLWYVLGVIKMLFEDPKSFHAGKGSFPLSLGEGHWWLLKSTRKGKQDNSGNSWSWLWENIIQTWPFVRSPQMNKNTSCL